MTLTIAIFAGAILALLVLSAFFSGSETALTATSRARMHELERRGFGRAGIVKSLVQTPERFIGAILLGNNLVNILASALATALFLKLFGDAGVVVATFVMTALVLIFAEVLPKTYAISNSDRMALAVTDLADSVVRHQRAAHGRAYPHWLLDVGVAVLDADRLRAHFKVFPLVAVQVAFGILRIDLLDK